VEARNDPDQGEAVEPLLQSLKIAGMVFAVWTFLALMTAGDDGDDDDGNGWA
jgi:hypothetical protein